MPLRHRAHLSTHTNILIYQYICINILIITGVHVQVSGDVVSPPPPPGGESALERALSRDASDAISRYASTTATDATGERTPPVNQAKPSLEDYEVIELCIYIHTHTHTHMYHLNHLSPSFSRSLSLLLARSLSLSFESMHLLLVRSITHPLISFSLSVYIWWGADGDVGKACIYIYVYVKHI